MPRIQMRRRRIPAAWGALAAVAAGCASTGQPSPSAAALDELTRLDHLPGKPGCFWTSNFQGDWTVLNESTVIVHAPSSRDAYVIKLFEPVFDLGFKESLGLEDRERSGRICDNGDDYLVVPGWQPPRVPIVAVHFLTQPEEARLLRAAGRPVPHPQAVAQPGSPRPPAAPQ